MVDEGKKSWVTQVDEHRARQRDSGASDEALQAEDRLINIKIDQDIGPPPNGK